MPQIKLPLLTYDLQSFSDRFSPNDHGRYVKEHALQDATSIFGASSGKAIEVITIDDYVASKAITKADLIKMDIKGAERLAFQGALESIKRFRPRLAICVYHLWDDVFEIPKLIAATGVEYKFSFK